VPWVRLDDRITEHPKIVEVGPLGLALFVAGLAYCNRNLTDGFIPWATAQKLLSWQFLEPPENGDGQNRTVMDIGISSGLSGADINSDYVVTLLVTAGLWEKRDDGYTIHDFLDSQPSKKQALSARKKDRARQHKHRKRASSEDSLSRGTSRRDSGPCHGDVTVDPVPDPVSISKRINTSDEFEQFWAIYPKKKAKVVARKEWPAARKKVELEPLLAALRRAIASEDWQRDEGKWIPWPAKWLKQERWLDDYGIAKPKTAWEEEFERQAKGVPK
jgi:hypothetical protein